MAICGQCLPQLFIEIFGFTSAQAHYFSDMYNNFLAISSNYTCRESDGIFFSSRSNIGRPHKQITSITIPVVHADAMFDLD